MDFRVDRHDHGAVFYVTRQAKMNALTKAVWAGLDDLLTDLEQRKAKYLVIAGEGGRAFSAGTDLNESKLFNAEQRDQKNDHVRAFLFRLARSELITVAAVNGLAYGGGLELAMACSARIAVSTARLSMPEVKLGVLPTYGGTQFLVALAGAARASELMLSGRAISAQEGLMFGLITQIAADDSRLIEEAVAYATSLSALSPVAVAAIRRCVAAAGPDVTEQGLEVEGREARLVLQSEDAEEGVAAFLEKRPPVFKGR